VVGEREGERDREREDRWVGGFGRMGWGWE